jgi:PAS domain S-box-containing protein
MVEDDADDAELLARKLKDAGFNLQWMRVDTESAYLSALRQPLDIIFSDFSIPRFGGLRALQLLQSSGLDVPLILISGTVGEEVAVEAMRWGATDYLLKDHVVRLVSAVERALNETQLRAERRRTQEALRHSEQRLRSIIDHTMDCIMVVTPEGVISEVNHAGLIMLEAGSVASVQAKPFLEFISLQYRQAFQDLHHRVLEGQSELLEFEIHGLKDRRRWLEAQAGPLLDAAGRAEAVICIARDITERKHSEELLRESNHRFEMLARATNDAVRDWDLKTNSVWWNEGFETLFGFRRDENESSIDAWRDRIHPEDRERVDLGVQQLIQSGELWSCRYRFRRRDGTYAHVVDRGQIIRDEHGNAVRMLAGMTDITERIALEDQLRQSHRLEAVGQLTGGVAHDFNNLLTVILGNAELLLEQVGMDSSQRELAEMIVGAANNAAELTERLLAFARKQALDPISVDSNTLVSGMYPLLRRTLGAHIDIDTIPGPGLWQALVDPAQLENALLNLCINARDAMSGGGRLLIETKNVELDQDYVSGQVEVEPGEYVLIEVTDSGSGIAPEILLRVFEPFFTTKDKGKGTGLGLAMVYGFIKQSGGHINIYSEPGHGTAVKMYLPRIAGQYVPLPEATGTFRIIQGTETILLVEDDEKVRRLVLSQLKSLGYHVLEARNGVQALEILAQGDPIDLLFTDVVMPGGISGRQLADAARQRRPNLKVLFTSGYTEDAIVHHGRLDPGVQLLAKPYRRSELARRTRSILDAP